MIISKTKKALTILSFSALLLAGCSASGDTSDTSGVNSKMEDEQSSEQAGKNSEQNELIVSLGMEPEDGFDPTTG